MHSAELQASPTSLWGSFFESHWKCVCVPWSIVKCYYSMAIDKSRKGERKMWGLFDEVLSLESSAEKRIREFHIGSYREVEEVTAAQIIIGINSKSTKNESWTGRYVSWSCIWDKKNWSLSVCIKNARKVQNIWLKNSKARRGYSKFHYWSLQNDVVMNIIKQLKNCGVWALSIPGSTIILPSAERMRSIEILPTASLISQRSGIVALVIGMLVVLVAEQHTRATRRNLTI